MYLEKDRAGKSANVTCSVEFKAYFSMKEGDGDTRQSFEARY